MRHKRLNWVFSSGMADLMLLALTLAVFAVLGLVVKGAGRL
ncbi:hypothetical protein [Actinomadura sp. KC345]|nr:hypothetical protein [Actinomadura sp. KC345]